jgi:hypothetical protein
MGRSPAEISRKFPDNVPLPVFETNASFVLLTGPVLREEAWPVTITGPYGFGDSVPAGAITVDGRGRPPNGGTAVLHGAEGGIRTRTPFRADHFE